MKPDTKAKASRTIIVRDYAKDGFKNTWARTRLGYARVQAETMGPEEFLQGEVHRAIGRFVEWPELTQETAETWLAWTRSLAALSKESLQEAA